MNEPFKCTIENLDKFEIGEVYHIHHDTNLGSMVDIYAILITIEEYPGIIEKTERWLQFQCISVYEQLSDEDFQTWGLYSGKNFPWHVGENYVGDMITKVS